MHRCYSALIMEDLIIQNFIDQNIIPPQDDIIFFLAAKAQEHYVKRSFDFNKKSRRIIRKCSVEYIVSQYLANEMLETSVPN